MSTARSARALSLACLLPLVLGVLVAPVPAAGTTRGTPGWVYYSRSDVDLNTEVWRARPGDPTSAEQLTSDDASNAVLAVSPDGREVLYSKDLDIWRMNADGTGETQVPTAGLQAGRVSYSPDGRRLALSSVATVFNIWLLDRDGTDSRPVFSWDVADTLKPRSVAWSPDGRRLAFTGISPTSGRRELMTSTTAGRDLQQLTSTADREVNLPEWSPDGRTILYRSQPSGGTPEAWAVRVDGEGERRLDHLVGQVDGLRFAPDGRVVAGLTTVDPSGVRLVRTTLAAGPLEDLVTDQSARTFDVTVAATPTQCDGRWATIVGTSASETIRGSVGHDVIVAGGGADTVTADAGDDVVCGGTGNDVLVGGAGRDRLLGAAGSDTLRAKDGERDARLDCGSGADAAAARDPRLDPAPVSCG